MVKDLSRQNEIIVIIIIILPPTIMMDEWNNKREIQKDLHLEKYLQVEDDFKIIVILSEGDFH